MTQKFKKSALAALLASALAAAPAFAAAPMVKTPAPGFFRIMLGEFEVTPVSDGTVDLPMDKLLTNTTPQAVDRALAQAYLKSPLETSDNAFLVNTGSKLVLIDSGAGSLFGPTLGKLVANIRAAGYQPEQIDEIYLTHMHGDHVGGLAANGKSVFPNAIVRSPKREADFWLSKANLDKAAENQKGGFKGAMASIAPYAAAGKFKPFEGDVELVPGVRSHGANGHTPGHTTYVVESGGQKLMLIGDLIHVAAIQFANPAVTISFDSDSKEAAMARKKEFDAAARGGYLIGGAHLPFPGLGHLRLQGKGYQFIPVNYTQMRYPDRARQAGGRRAAFQGEASGSGLRVRLQGEACAPGFWQNAEAWLGLLAARALVGALVVLGAVVLVAAGDFVLLCLLAAPGGVLLRLF